ncbi:hypothetical protein HDU77_011296, partial [Chytriomyces hyalinus]
MAHTQSPLQTRMPPEILQDIFSWIEPCAAPKYTRLCSIINRSIKTRHFVRLNLDKFRIQSPLDADTNLKSRTEFKAKPWKKIRENSRNLWTKLSYYEQRLVSFNCLTVVRTQWNLTSLAHMKRLETLCVRGSYARLPTNLVEEVGSLTKLEDLDLSWNDLTGSLPSGLYNLTTLTSINLERNQISGTLPNSISNLANLKQLRLGNNAFSGSLPHTIGNLHALILLDLHSNLFDGDIPESLGSCAALQKLDLGCNRFSGAIPTSFGDLKDLQILSLTRNHLSGRIPSEFGNLQNLNVLALGGNKFDATDCIPKELEQLNELRELHLWWEDGSEDKPGFLDQFSPDSNIFRLLQASSGDTEVILDGEGDVSDQDNGGFDLSDEDEDADDFDYAGLGEGFMIHDGKKYKHLGEHKSDDSDASDESDDEK